MLLLSLRSPIYDFMTSTKNGQQITLPLPPSLKKWAIDLLFKIMKSTNTWQLLRTPLSSPLLCRLHKCMFSFCFFKVWSVTCLNANEILNFMKIQSSYLLSSYQRNQASLYFQLYQLLFEQLFGKFMSVTIIYVCYSWKDFVFEM